MEHNDDICCGRQNQIALPTTFDYLYFGGTVSIARGNLKKKKNLRRFDRLLSHVYTVGERRA